MEPRSNFTTRFTQILAAGAHFVQTTFPTTPTLFPSTYTVRLCPWQIACLLSHLASLHALIAAWTSYQKLFIMTGPDILSPIIGCSTNQGECPAVDSLQPSHFWRHHLQCHSSVHNRMSGSQCSDTCCCPCCLQLFVGSAVVRDY